MRLLVFILLSLFVVTTHAQVPSSGPQDQVKLLVNFAYKKTLSFQLTVDQISQFSNAISQLGDEQLAKNPRIVDLLIDYALNSSVDELSLAAIQSMGNFHGESSKANLVLIAILENEDEFEPHREMAAQALGKTRPENLDNNIIDALIAPTVHPTNPASKIGGIEQAILWAVCTAMGNLESTNSQIIAALIKTSSYGDGYADIAALTSLSKIKPRPSGIETALKNATRNKNVSVANAAKKILNIKVIEAGFF